MKLSHTTKVTIRKALAALRSIDETKNSTEFPDQDFRGFPLDAAAAQRGFFELLDSDAYRTATKAGFRNRADLEQFARKHHLLKNQPHDERLDPPDFPEDYLTFF